MIGHRVRGRMATATVLSAMTLVVLNAGIVNVAVPDIGRALAVTPSSAMLIVTGHQVVLLAALLPCAHLAEPIGQRRLFRIGLFAFVGATLLCAMSNSLPLLVGARCFQGLGSAAILALGMALLRMANGDESLGSAIAANAMVVAVGSAVAPALGGLLLAIADWHWLFIASLPVGLLSLAASPALPEPRVGTGSIDLIGISLYGVAAGGAFTAVELARTMPGVAAGITAGAIACGGWLFVRDREKALPILPLDLLALRPFRSSVLASILLFTGQSAALLALPFHLQLSLGRSIAITGMVIVLWPLAAAISSRVANRLADRFGSEVLCAAGAVLLACGLTGAALSRNEDGIAPLAACVVACGTGFGLFQVPNNRVMFLAGSVQRSAAAGGLQATARLTGQTAGAFLVTYLLWALPITVGPRLALGLAAGAELAAAGVSWQMFMISRRSEGSAKPR